MSGDVTSTAIMQKYMGTLSVSNSVLISLQAMSTFLCSLSGISRLNCRIRQWGLALGLLLVAAGGCCGTVVVFQVGLITIGLADFTHHGAGVASVCGVIIMRGS